MKLAYFVAIVSHLARHNHKMSCQWAVLGQNVFTKNNFAPYGVHKQVKSAPLEPILSDFGPSQVLKSLKKGPFWDHKWLNSGSKSSFFQE